MSRSKLRRTIAQSPALVVDENTIEVAGVRYCREGTVPKGAVPVIVVEHREHSMLFVVKHADPGMTWIGEGDHWLVPRTEEGS